MLAARQGCQHKKQGSRDLLERRQRRVALERLREHLDVRGADRVAIQAAARREVLGMLAARQGRQHKAGRARLTRATSSSSMHSQAPRYFSRL